MANVWQTHSLFFLSDFQQTELSLGNALGLGKRARNITKLFVGTDETVRNIGVSVERGSTVLIGLIFAQYGKILMSRLKYLFDIRRS